MMNEENGVNKKDWIYIERVADKRSPGFNSTSFIRFLDPPSKLTVSIRHLFGPCREQLAT
jgi:hypothetical protein